MPVLQRPARVAEVPAVAARCRAGRIGGVRTHRALAPCVRGSTAGGRPSGYVGQSAAGAALRAGTRKQAKIGRLDARMLADMGVAHGAQLRWVMPLTSAQRELWDLQVQRRDDRGAARCPCRSWARLCAGFQKEIAKTMSFEVSEVNCQWQSPALWRMG